MRKIIIILIIALTTLMGENIYTNNEQRLSENITKISDDNTIISEENTIIRHPKYPFLFASLDGTLVKKETGEAGVLEIKTSEILRSMQKEKWKDGVPQNYYCQVLHYLNVTGYGFAYLFAELTYSNDIQTNKTYEFDAEKLKDEMNYLEKKEIEFWKYVEMKKEPPLLLPNI